MYDDLTPTQQTIYDFIIESGCSVTAKEIADRMGYNSTSVVRDHISGLRRQGIDIDQVTTYKYELPEE